MMQALERTRWIGHGLAVLLLLNGWQLQSRGEGSSAGVQEFDPQAFPGYVVDDVVVPVPSEVFSVLDKLGDPNWKQEIKKLDLPNTGDRIRLALMFGTVVAEGFVAVQAEDRQSVQDIGREVISLAKSLGLSKSVLPHAQAILDAADRDDWSSIRREFDRTQKTVQDTMEDMKDADLSQCVSLGGWLRGTSTVTSIITKAFSADRAELLNQPMLVEHFIAVISKMPEGTRKHSQVVRILAGLHEVLKRMESAVDGFSQESVEKIGGVCGGLLGEIRAAK